MSFKKGDWVVRTEGSAFFTWEGGVVGEHYKVESVKGNGSIVLRQIPDRLFDDRHFELALLDNALNRKLYPNRVVCQGFLIPAKSAAKLNEEKDQRE